MSESNSDEDGDYSTFEGDDLVDRLLTNKDLKTFVTPSIYKWEDHEIFKSFERAGFSIDSAKEKAWDYSQIEADHVRNSVRQIIECEEVIDEGILWGKDCIC